MNEENPIRDKSYAFALRVVKLCRYLNEERREYVLSKQLLRAGTSIGANVEEASGGQSDRDFTSKLAIAYKEARETCYWLRLLRDSDYLTPKQADSLLADNEELLRLLGSIIRTMRLKIRRT